MDKSKTQSQPSEIKNKLIQYHVPMMIFLLIIISVISYILGRSSLGDCKKSVLGVQSSDSIVSRLALLFNADLERPSQNINTIRIAPTTKPTTLPTEIPTPTSSEDEQDLIWAGLNREPKPSSTPAPNNVITVPEPTEDVNEPTPTPQYKVNWDRNNHEPTPTPNNVIIEATAEAAKTGTTQQPEKISIAPIEIQNLIENAGAQMDKIQLTRKEGEKSVRVSGELREKLFGFITVGYPISIKVDIDMGTIETASIPWWRTLFGNPFIGKISQIRCGDGICSPKESFDNCKQDCTPICGNGICEYGEGQDNCPADCELIPTVEPTINQ